MFCLLWLIAFGFLLYFRAVELRAKGFESEQKESLLELPNRLSLWWCVIDQTFAFLGRPSGFFATGAGMNSSETGAGSGSGAGLGRSVNADGIAAGRSCEIALAANTA